MARWLEKTKINDYVYFWTDRIQCVFIPKWEPRQWLENLFKRICKEQALAIAIRDNTLDEFIEWLLK